MHGGDPQYSPPKCWNQSTERQQQQKAEASWVDNPVEALLQAAHQERNGRGAGGPETPNLHVDQAEGEKISQHAEGL